MSKREKNTLRVDSYLLYLVKIAAIDQNVLPRDVVEMFCPEMWSNRLCNNSLKRVYIVTSK